MGKRFRFIHCSDLHLGMPIADIGGSRVHWDEALRDATMQAFRNIVDLALEKRVIAIIIAGDVYNAADHSLAAQLEFSRELYRAAQAGIRIFIAHGNHDPLGAWRAEIPLPPTAHVFRSDRVEGFPLTVDGETVAMVYGRSYDRAHVDEHWARDFIRETDAPYAIGVLHTQGPAGGEEGVYAPCTRTELEQAGMNYWALGHAHTRSITASEPFIAHPGNPQSLNRREIGPRGCYLVEVGTYGTTIPEFYETDAIRREIWDISIEDMQSAEEFIAAVGTMRKERREAVGKPILAELRCTGRGVLQGMLRDREVVDALLNRLNEQEYYKHIFICCYRLDDRTLPAINWDERKNLPDAVGDYLRACERIGADGEELLRHLRAYLATRPEWVRYERYFGELTDERLLTAWQKAEIEGAERILGEYDNEID